MRAIFYTYSVLLNDNILAKMVFLLDIFTKRKKSRIQARIQARIGKGTYRLSGPQQFSLRVAGPPPFLDLGVSG